ncbi:MAG TPA: thiazole synthase [Rhodospirillaceae bacterium]|jgi:thiazole synthase|nr:thiazole synthase [Alphaproteobacteria bacterium]HBH26663.1 thiazole synthase [Rhodospirillaceae bacterium]
MEGALVIDGVALPTRLFLGTAGYPSPDVLNRAIEAARPGLVTVSLRREQAGGGTGAKFWDLIRATGVPVLPNTAGCATARDAITTAHMAREVFGTHWIKLETIADDYTLAPDSFALAEAAGALVQDGFTVFPYMTEDLALAQKLYALGCRVLMPWGAPIGTGRGVEAPGRLKRLRARFPDAALVVDAGLGAPSHAAAAMELGADAVLLNTAVARARDPVAMARAFAQAVEAGRAAYRAGLIAPQDAARPSTPVVGRPL